MWKLRYILGKRGENSPFIGAMRTMLWPFTQRALHVLQMTFMHSHLIRYFLSPRRKAGQRILLLFQRGGIWGSDVGLCQGRLASVWQSGIQIQVIWLLSSGSSFLGFGGVWLGWRWRQHGMTLPKPAFLLPAQPFYPTLCSHGSGTDISLTDIMNFPSVHV